MMEKCSTEGARLLWIRTTVLVCVAIVTAGCVYRAAAERGAQGRCVADTLCVAFLDVGQGDAIFIRAPGGGTMLVDGGRDATVLRELGAVTDTHRLDYVVATHPDADHIGGLAEVVRRYRPGRILQIASAKRTRETDALEQAVADAGAERIVARAGQVYDLGGGVQAIVLHPFVDMPDADANDASIVLMVSYGDADVVLTGDAPRAAEYGMRRAYGAALNAEVVKAGHHGSRTSSDSAFIATVAPKMAIISAGKDNRYGHPHKEVVANFLAARTTLLSTADNGTIILETDGDTIKVRNLKGR